VSLLGETNFIQVIAKTMHPLQKTGTIAFARRAAIMTSCTSIIARCWYAHPNKMNNPKFQTSRMKGFIFVIAATDLYSLVV